MELWFSDYHTEKVKVSVKVQKQLFGLQTCRNSYLGTVFSGLSHGKSQGVGQGAETVIWFTDRVSADRCV